MQLDGEHFSRVEVAMSSRPVSPKESVGRLKCAERGSEFSVELKYAVFETPRRRVFDAETVASRIATTITRVSPSRILKPNPADRSAVFAHHLCPSDSPLVSRATASREENQRKGHVQTPRFRANPNPSRPLGEEGHGSHTVGHQTVRGGEGRKPPPRCRTPGRRSHRSGRVMTRPLRVARPRVGDPR